MIQKIFFTGSLLILFILNGCSSIKDTGKDLGQSLIEPIVNSSDTLGYNLVKGMRESLTSEESKQKIGELVDSIITIFGRTTNKQLVGIRDSLLGDYITKWLQDDLLGDKTAARLVHLRNSFFDSYLKKYISDLTAGIGTSILNDSTLMRAGALRDSLIGDRTKGLITAIVDSALATFSSRFNNDISPQLKGNLSFIEKNASWLLILIGAIAIAIIGYVWWRKEKYLKLTKVLTYQISEVPDEKLKETLKTNISKNAKTIGIENDLRMLLDKDGLLHLDRKQNN